MTIRIDPEQNEVRALKGLCDWRGARVIEIGCGQGRLTTRLAQLGAIVHAIDPDPALVRKARTGLPQRFAKRVRFKAGKAERRHNPADDPGFGVIGDVPNDHAARLQGAPQQHADFVGEETAIERRMVFE